MFCWLLKEAKMPAVDETNIGALAQYYAAVKGCPICVKLLLESCPELRGSCGCIDSLDYWNSHLPGHRGNQNSSEKFYLKQPEPSSVCPNELGHGNNNTTLSTTTTSATATNNELHFNNRKLTATHHNNHHNNGHQQLTSAHHHHHHHHAHHAHHHHNRFNEISSKASDSGKESVADEDSLIPPSTSSSSNEPFYLHDPGSLMTCNDRVKKLFRKNRPKTSTTSTTKVYEKIRKSETHSIKLVKAEVYQNSDEGNSLSESSDPLPDYDQDSMKLNCPPSSSPTATELNSSISSSGQLSESSTTSTDKGIYQEFDDLEKAIYQEVDDLEHDLSSQQQQKNNLQNSLQSKLLKKRDSSSSESSDYGDQPTNQQTPVNGASTIKTVYSNEKLYSIEARPLTKVAPATKDVKNLIAKLDCEANSNETRTPNSVNLVNQQTQTTPSIVHTQLPPPPPPPPPLGLLIGGSHHHEMVYKKDSSLSSSSKSSSEYDEPTSTSTSGSSERTRKMKTLGSNPQLAAAFIPPTFTAPPDSDTNIKPSEYLKRVAGKTTSVPRFASNGLGGGGCKDMIFFEKRKIKRSSSETHLYQPHSHNDYETIQDDDDDNQHLRRRSSSPANSEHLYETCSNNNSTNNSKSVWSNGSTNCGSTSNVFNISNNINNSNNNINGNNKNNGVTSVCTVNNAVNLVSSTLHNSKSISSESIGIQSKSTVQSNNNHGIVTSTLSTSSTCNFSVTQDELKRIHLRKTVKPSNERTTVLIHKNDVIAELKASKDLDGIKKRKETEKSRDEVKDKMAELVTEYTAEKFLDKIPVNDASGVPIPQWKRLMLAKKAAEKAKKEAEQEILMEHEKKRISSIPEWKRQLLSRKDDGAYGYISSASSGSSSASSASSSSSSVSSTTSSNCNTTERISVIQGSSEPCYHIKISSTISVNKNQRSTQSSHGNGHHKPSDSNSPWLFKLRKTNSVYW